MKCIRKSLPVSECYLEGMCGSVTTQEDTYNFEAFGDVDGFVFIVSVHQLSP